MSEEEEFEERAFDEWLKYNSSPPADMPLMAAAAVGQPVVTNAALVGPQAAEALMLDDGYTRASAGDRLAKLQQSPMTGCAKLMTLARTKSGYNAATPAAAASAQMFLNFVTQILVCPLFSTIRNDKVTPGFSGDWNSVINQIAGYYTGLSTADVNGIKHSLTAIAAAASSSPSTNETLNVFSQATLNAGSAIDVYMYHTYVGMKTTVRKGGKNEPDKVSNQANMTLYRVQLRFNAAAWPAHAAVVQQRSDQSLRGWLAEMSTPQGNLPSGWSPS